MAIKVPTTLVLGAGASFEYGFPTGRELLLRIAEALQGTNAITRLLAGNQCSRQECVSFGRELEHSQQPSIDAFLSIRRDRKLTEIGKIAIACSLIPHEDPEKIAQRQEKMHWYEYLFQQLDFTHEKVVSPISVVTFNYDRSLECFLYHAFLNSLGLEPGQALSLVRSIPVIHMYGQLGSFGFLDPHSKTERDYSKELLWLDRCTSSIQIIYESEAENDRFEEAKKLIRSAKKLCFLGFGFHKDNVARLSLDGFDGSRVIASSYRCGKDEIRRATNMIQQLVSYRIVGTEKRRKASKPQIDFATPEESCLDVLQGYPVFD